MLADADLIVNTNKVIITDEEGFKDETFQNTQIQNSSIVAEKYN